ncbi:MAG: tetratricopeptide repeat protein [Gemmataceae bacterium]
MAGIRIEIVVDHQGKEQRLNLLRQPDESLTDIVNDTLNRLNLPRNPPYWVAFSGGKPQRLTQSLAQAIPTAKKKDGAVVIELRAPEVKQAEAPSKKPAQAAPNNKQAAGKKEAVKAAAKMERSKDPDLTMTQPMPKSEAPTPPAKASPEKKPAPAAKAAAPAKAKVKEPEPPEPPPIKVEVSVNYKDKDLSLSMERKGIDSLLEILHDILSELDLPRNPPSWAVWSEDQPHRLIETLERAVPKSVAAGFVKLEVIAGETEVESWNPLAADTDLDLSSGAMYEGGGNDILFGSDDEEAAEAAPDSPFTFTNEAEDAEVKSDKKAERPRPSAAAPAPAPPPAPAAPAPERARRMAAPEPSDDLFQNEGEAVAEAAPAELGMAAAAPAAPVEDDQFFPGARDEARATGAETGIPDVGADLDEMPSSTQTLPMPTRAGRAPAGGATVNRHAAVRYYSRMNPARAYPFAVVISDKVLSEIEQRDVAQAVSKGFKATTGAVMEIEPILPGCYVYPPKREVRVRPGDVVAKFCIVPHLEGDLLEPHVLVRQEGLTLAEIPLEMRVVKQTATWAMGIAAFVAPLASAFLRYSRVDVDAKVNEGLGLFTNLIRLFFGVLPPEILWLLLLGITIGLYFTLRPQEKDLFWELKTVTPDSVLAKAQKTILAGDVSEGLNMLDSLLQSHPEFQAAWLACGKAHFEQDDLEESLRCYDQALNLGPAHADDFSRAIKSATKLNRHERAHTLMVQARKSLAASDFKALQALLQG